MNAREAAEAHGGKVVSGDRQGSMSDFTQEAIQEFMKTGIRPPQNVGSYEVIPVGDGESTFDIVYTGATDKVTIRSHWQQVNGEWKIVRAEPGGVDSR